jgi:hypothetical protein
VLNRSFCSLAAVTSACVGCQGDPAPEAPVARLAIEVVAAGKVVASVLPGHPCRATVAGVELLIGGPPLLSQAGSTRWTGETMTNGTTFRNNDRAVARIHANQLFDDQGIPILRVMDDGTIVNGPGRVVRKALAKHAAAPRVEIRDAEPQKRPETIVVTNTEDIVLAAILSANEVEAEIRALVACHYLLGAPAPVVP